MHLNIIVQVQVVRLTCSAIERWTLPAYSACGDKGAQQSQSHIRQGKGNRLGTTCDTNHLPLRKYFHGEHEETLRLEDGQRESHAVTELYLPSAGAIYSFAVDQTASVLRHSTAARRRVFFTLWTIPFCCISFCLPLLSVSHV